MGLLVLIGLGLLAAVGAASWAAFYLDPETRTLRALTRALGRAPDAAAVAPRRRQGLAMAAAEGLIAVIRGPGDLGLVYDLRELLGVELVFDGQVAARIFQGEPRRPLDHLAPQARQVALRLVFDDLEEPEFELELLLPGDFNAKRPPDPAAQVAVGRRWFTRLEAVVRRVVTEAESL